MIESFERFDMSWTYTNLVHDGNAGGLGLSIELHHSGRDVASGNDVLLLANSRLNDGGMEGIRDQADDKVMLGDLSIESLIVGDIEGDGGGVLDTLRELLSRGKSTAGCRTQAQMSA